MLSLSCIVVACLGNIGDGEDKWVEKIWGTGAGLVTVIFEPIYLGHVKRDT